MVLIANHQVAVVALVRLVKWPHQMVKVVMVALVAHQLLLGQVSLMLAVVVVAPAELAVLAVLAVVGQEQALLQEIPELLTLAAEQVEVE
jgi:hypothetical protein